MLSFDTICSRSWNILTDIVGAIGWEWEGIERREGDGEGEGKWITEVNLQLQIH